MELVIMKNQQAVTSSLQVAELFRKNHRDVLSAIDDLKEGVAENYADLFYDETYIHPQNKQTYRQIIMNRDGFTLLAMGFTGKQALQFKLKYIEAFNEMENHIKQQIDTSSLSPELQMFNGLFKALANQELATKQLENKVDNISEIVRMDAKDWRKKANTILRKIAVKLGGFEKYKEIGNQSYQMLEMRARCDLTRRLENRKKNMIVQGVGKTTVKRFNKLDVIAEDARLTEIYLSVLKDMAIRFDVDFDDIA